MMESYTSDAAVTQLGYIGVGVSDVSRWVEFATRLLGLQENASEGGVACLRMDSRHHRIELHPTGEDDIIFAGWEARDAEALEEIALRVRARGLDVRPGTAAEAAQRKVLGLVRFTDPEGLATEVYYGPLVDTAPFASPRGIGRFVAEGLGLGHIVLGAQDPQAYVAFYREVLGARLSDHIHAVRAGAPLDLVFLHVNPRHHSLAVVRQPPGTGEARAKRIRHVMFEVEDLDDVGVTLALLQANGVATGPLGRHPNDRMLSFYAETPSGFQVEFGCGGLLIADEASWSVRHHLATSVWGHGPLVRPQPAA